MYFRNQKNNKKIIFSVQKNNFVGFSFAQLPKFGFVIFVNIHLWASSQQENPLWLLLYELIFLKSQISSSCQYQTVSKKNIHANAIHAYAIESTNIMPMRVNVSHKLSELVFKMLKSSSFFIDELLSIFNDMRIYIIYPICQYVRLYMYLVAVCVNFSTVFFFPKHLSPCCCYFQHSCQYIVVNTSYPH